MKTKKEIKNFYSFKNYKPNKNSVPVTYKGTEYLSKAQCMALEGITRKELDEYLKDESNPKGSFISDSPVVNSKQVDPVYNIDSFNDDDF